MPKLIFAWNYVEWGGVQTSTIPLIRKTSARYRVYVVMPVGSSPELQKFLEDAGAECEFFQPRTDVGSAPTIYKKLQRRWRKRKSERSLVRHLLKMGLDSSIIHLDLTPQKSFISLLRLCLRTHVFFTLHNSFSKAGLFRELIWTIKLRLISQTKRFHFFAANEDAARYIRHYVSADAANRITLVRDAIDPETIQDILEKGFDGDKTLAKHGLPKTQTLVLTVGQFVDRKGRWIYLETIRRICQLRRDILFAWVVPEIPDQSDLNRVAEYGVEKNFRLILSRNLGNSRSDVLSFFRIADIFVLPSIIEGVPIALIEAMAMGIPCISTRAYGIPEAIESGKTGLLVEPGDSDALEKAILYLIGDEEYREKLAKVGQAFVKATFDERESIRSAIEEYDRCFVGNQVKTISN
jgi:glycosyltransferase involved in cell wall biosynthesis